MPDAPVAQRLLDAQVAWVIGRLTGPELPDLVAASIDDVLAAGAELQLDELVTREDVKRIAVLLAERVPSSTAASTFVEVAAEVAHEGPAEDVTFEELLDRDHVDRLTSEALALTDVLEAALDRLTASPTVNAVASRFVGRIVNDVMAQNRAIAEKVPGMGSLMSLGTSAAGKVIGAADKQLDGALGDAAGKSANYAVRRLNKIIVDTLNDPATHRAVLEVYDLYADHPLPRLSQVMTLDDVRRVAGLIQEIVIAGAPSRPVTALVASLIDGFYDVYGGHPVTVLLEDLAITRDDLVAEGVAIAPRVFAAAQESGELEGLVRAQLAPFFDSPEVAAILA